MNTLTAFKHWIHDRCGLQLEGLAEERLMRAIEALAQRFPGQSHAALLTRLQSDDALFEDFVSHLTVNETYFFRELEALDWLAKRYLPARLAQVERPLRVLSAGCSSGEEPYSLAMLLLEHLGEQAPARVAITGGDLDQRELAKARTGLYGGMAFRATPPDLKARYFTPQGQRFRLTEPLREWVDFVPLNVLAPEASAFVAPFDVILFRNVSIYFDAPTRKHIQRHLKALLAPGGVLLCGITEIIGNDLGVLMLTDDQGIFHFRHPTSAPAPDSKRAPVAAPATPVLASPFVPDAAQAVAPDTAPQASVAPLSLPWDVRLHNAQTQLNANDFDAADSAFAALLAQQPWSVDALVLAGLAARWCAHPEQALAHFKRAIYVAPDCWPAHYYLAELYRQGELADVPLQRQRSYAAVVRLLEETPASVGSFSVVAPPLPPGDALFLARRHLMADTVTQGAH